MCRYGPYYALAHQAAQESDGTPHEVLDPDQVIDPNGLGAEGPAGLPGLNEPNGLGAEGPAGLPGLNETKGLGAEGPAGLPGLNEPNEDLVAVTAG